MNTSFHSFPALFRKTGSVLLSGRSKSGCIRRAMVRFPLIRCQAILGLTFLLVAPSFAQSTPIVSGIVSASDFGEYPAAVAPGSWVEIYGSKLAGSARAWAASDFTGAAAPTALGGVTVTVNGTPAYVEYVSPGQINVQFPSTLATGAATVVVNNQGASSAPFAITVNALEPGLLAPASFKVNGTQYVAAFHASTGALVSNGGVPGVAYAPALPGEELIFYGVGFGPVTQGAFAGVIASGLTTLTNPFGMIVGGAPATILYDGLTPGDVGLYQFNVVLPSNLLVGDLPLQITLNGSIVTLQTFSLSVVGPNGPSAPGSPTGLIPTAGNGTATIAFNAPVSNGGAAITGYTAACTAGNAKFTGSATTSPILVTGLSNGTTYTCTVTAANLAGTSSPSASVSVTPVSPVISTLTLTSTAVQNGGFLPATYTCDGTGSTLPLSWANAPASTAEFALLLSTAPTPGTIKYDWVLYHIPATTTSLAKDSFLVGTVGVGDDGPGTVYDPPCSQGPGAKDYTFTLYALSAAPTFSVPATQVTGELVASAIAPLTLVSASLNVSYSRDPSTAPGSGTNCLYIRNSLQVAKSGATSIGCDGTYAYISSIGLPVGSTSDSMMNGITSTNLQVPTATDFQGANGWKIPLSPVLAASATQVPSGPIGVAINGVPIFNPCVQNGNCTATNGDTKGEGQLDTCNGHAGRADDYHYHAAPNCLMAEQSNVNYWNTHPVGWLLDGFAVFGYYNADGSTPARDSCGGTTVTGSQAPSGYPYSYAYHVISTFPYITNNCISGLPSPDLANQASKYNPMRQPPVTPFNDTNMTLTTDPSDGYQVLQFTSPTSFTTTETGSDSYPNPPGTYKIRYIQVTGAALEALLAMKQNANATACWNFEFVDGNGNTTQPSISYCKTNP